MIDMAAERQIRHVRSFQTGKHSRESQQLLNGLAKARVCLLNAEEKAEYDGNLRHELTVEQERHPPAEPPRVEQPPAFNDSPQASSVAIDFDEPTTLSKTRSRVPATHCHPSLLARWRSPAGIGAAIAGGLVALISLLWMVALFSLNEANTNIESSSAPPTPPAESVEHSNGTSSPASETASLLFSWPLLERADAKVWIDGQEERLPDDNDTTVRIPVPPGTHSVKVERIGFKSIEFPHILLVAGQSKTLSLRWHPDESDTRGLNAEYFADRNFDTKALERIDRQVDWLWGWDAPDSSVPKDGFSIRWSGWLKPPKEGTYKLVTVSDDGVRFWIDDRMVVDNWGGHPPSRNEAAVELGTQPHKIRIDYFDNASSATMSLRWITPNGIELPVPAEWFFADLAVAKEASVPAYQPDEPSNSSGLTGEFFEGPDLNNLVATRVDRNIDFMWGFDELHPQLPLDNVTVRWTGWLTPPEAGDYEIATVADDAVRVWLDDRLIIDDWTDGYPHRKSVKVTLEAKRHPVRIEYRENNQSALVSVRWRTPRTSREEIIPPSAFSREAKD